MNNKSGITRRVFIRNSGVVAATAVAVGWVGAARVGQAVGPADATQAAGLHPASGEGNVERTTELVDGAWRPGGWLRGGGTHRLRLLPHGIEVTSPYRGSQGITFEEFLHGAAHDEIRSSFGGSVLEEALVETHRRAVCGVRT